MKAHAPSSRLPDLIAIDRIEASEERRALLRALIDALFGATDADPVPLPCGPEGAAPDAAPSFSIEDISLLVDGDSLPALARIYRSQGVKGLAEALAHSADIDFALAAAILGERRLDALAVVCRASGFSLAVFLIYLTALPQSPSTADEDGLVYAGHYQALSRETALRAMRFRRARLSLAPETAAPPL